MSDKQRDTLQTFAAFAMAGMIIASNLRNIAIHGRECEDTEVGYRGFRDADIVEDSFLLAEKMMKYMKDSYE